MTPLERRLAALEKQVKTERRMVLTFKGLYDPNAPGAWQPASGLTFSEVYHAQTKDRDT